MWALSKSQQWQRAASKLSVVGLGLVLAGCSSLATKDQPQQDPVYLINCSEVVQPEHRVELDAIDAAMEDRQYYAALAQLEALSFGTQAHWLRWAQLLGQVDQLDDSEQVFQEIVNECGSYQALHGLGVVKVKQGNSIQALALLSEAKDKAPANGDIRNDLGYVLMQTGRYDRAAFELRTAYELSRGRASTRQNLIAAYYLNGGNAAIQQLQQQVDLTDDQIVAGIRQANQLAGLSFNPPPPAGATKILDDQAQRPAKGGELSEPVMVNTLERLSDSFRQPIPQRIGESSRED
ncbi:tetratricopeptide repeat protein [Marinobacter halophilus]|uniref:Uncharacterized protein n=1 Tax=Marinobacter halophilus TaxID=1323740 RepID=A0A2T1KE18_9GAMM|nr:tetratricopeptide repeat protein [Marinobacter halophilus]PSF07782.1 hypothetical protein C7H08_10230 [Marinobacter halophilus]GGC57008.1 hypothetical protein GCM10011362_01720 [Marinobacter halophilus]